MAQVLSEKVVKTPPPAAAGNRVCCDAEVRGFVVSHRARRRGRRTTIGSHPDWPVQAAREKARKLKRAIDVGKDPTEPRHAENGAPAVTEVARRYLGGHVIALRPKTKSEYKSMLRGYILLELGALRLAALTTGDVRRLHDRVKSRPCRAHRLVTLVASITAWDGERSGNPVRGVTAGQHHGHGRGASLAITAFKPNGRFFGIAFRTSPLLSTA